MMRRVAVVGLLLAAAATASAEDLTLNLAQADTNIGALFTKYFNFAFMLAGILAFGVIVYGGFQYMISAGNPSGQSDARDRVLQAIIGLLLLVGAGLILRTIDPGLLNITLGTLSELQAPAPACSPQCKPNEGCLIDQMTKKGTCVQCSLDCGKDGVCAFTGANQTPECITCSEDTKNTCALKGEVCKAVGNQFVCAPEWCGDGGKKGPCPTGCTCENFPGTPRPYECVKQNSTEKCPGGRPPAAAPAAGAGCTMCRWQDPNKPTCGIIGDLCSKPPSVPGCSFQQIGQPTPC